MSIPPNEPTDNEQAGSGDDALSNQDHPNQELSSSVAVSGLYKDWFLDYASYVILERAVPAIEDGLKPVQRRILHALRQMDDGRFHKVANVIGQTMQFHPHGDAAIGDALVNMGQKDLLIETQGNWGDIRTGDRAAAPRYIEARLSKFALEIAFNKNTTFWQSSYDGRNKEPVTLPVKFPLLLAQGVEGIAVGLSTKIMPHNFIELIRASISVLKGRSTKLLPDFPTGGQVDATDYKRGHRGGKLRVRARIEILDKKTLVIREIPYATTTGSLIDSIIKANDKGKIKIKKVVDNTAADIELLIEIAPGVSPEVTMDALYAFTQCEISISPNACVIIEDKPHFTTVDEILAKCTHDTRELLRRELEIRQAELEENWHSASLEKIFIENRIYRQIEECDNWESGIETIDKGLDPYKSKLFRPVTREDIIRLTEIKIKRISRYDAFRADNHIARIEEELEEVRHHLNNLTDYAIAYYEKLLEKYGVGRERKTRICTFDNIESRAVAASNVKLYVDHKEGFIGWGLRKSEFLTECSDLDDVIVIRKDGILKVVRVSEKVFVGKDLLYAGIWKKGDERMTYHLIYGDQKAKKVYVKRFNVTAITREKEYDLCKAGGKAKVHYLSCNPNGESEVVTVYLSQGSKARKKVFDYDFAELSVKNRNAKGNTLTPYAVRKVIRKELGQSTLGGREIWMDDAVGRLNTEERGRLIGSFDTADQLVCIYRDGTFVLCAPELSIRFEMDKVLYLEKYDASRVISAVYQHGERGTVYVKRFRIEGAQNKPCSFISEFSGSKLLYLSTALKPHIRFELRASKGKSRQTKELLLDEFIDVKGWKALGKKLSATVPVGKIKDVEAPEAPEASEKSATPEKRTSKSKPKPEKPRDDTGPLSIGGEVEWDLDKGTTTRKEGKKPGGRKKKPPKGSNDENNQGELF